MRINEITQSPDDRIVDYIREHCQQYLDEVGGLRNALSKLPLWRGISRYEFGTDVAVITPVPQNRKPTATDLSIQTLADDWFQEQFGIRFRQSSVFCTGMYEDARSYQYPGGTTLIVLPVGDYDYCWSPIITDLYTVLPTAQDIEDGSVVSEYLDRGKYKFNTELVRGIESTNEIMLHCKQVMMIDATWHKLYTGFDE